VLDLFGGISTALVTMLQAGILVRKHLYVERDETARRVSSRHLALLMQRYSELLPRSTIQGYQRALPLDIALLGVQDLVRIGPINLVIARWPCQGHTRAGCGEGLCDPRSRMFWEMLRVLHHL
jgi:site-specific DNA-cytosine methylase